MSQVERQRKRQPQQAAKMLADLEQARRLRPKRIAVSVQSAMQAFSLLASSRA